jgi:hypothetical protein
MVNYMPEVAKMLGVEMNKDFECEESSCTYRITEHGLTCNGCYGADSLMMILSGKYTIKQGPWKPETDVCFCYMDQNGRCRSHGWDNDAHSLNYYKIGNCYKTSEEAEVNRDKWVEFYSSDDVLEV